MENENIKNETACQKKCKSKSVFTIVIAAIVIAACFFIFKHGGKSQVKMPAVNEETTITSSIESYQLGVMQGQSLKNDLVKNMGFDVNFNELVQGLEDGYNGTEQYDEETGQRIFNQFQTTLMNNQRALQEEQAKKIIDEGNAYQSTFEKQEGVEKLESGLLYKIVAAGNNHHPKTDSIVSVTYKGQLTDGTIFDQSAKPVTFPLSSLIQGWQQALPLIGVGGKIEIVVPPQLAYGQAGSAGIPPNSTLHFEIELVNVDQPKAEKKK